MVAGTQLVRDCTQLEKVQVQILIIIKNIIVGFKNLFVLYKIGPSVHLSSNYIMLVISLLDSINKTNNHTQ